jgi:hypothetical protein
MMRAAGHVRDDFGLLGIRHTGLKHADDRCGTILSNTPKVNGFANDRRIPLEGLGPETIGENNDGGGLGAVILWPNEAPEYGTQAHDLEKRPVNYAAINFARLAESDNCKGYAGEVAERAESLDPSV